MVEMSVHSTDGAEPHTHEELKYELRGIPESAFVLGQENVLVQGRSGTSTLKVKTTPCYLLITDAADDVTQRQKRYVFHAHVAQGTLSILARTRRVDENGELKRHPDLYARDLMIKAVSYFDAAGTQVDALQLSWHNTEGISDNYNTFLRYFADGEVVTPESVTKAVFSTWSGKIAWQLGFREIASLVDLLDDDKWKQVINVMLKRSEKVKISLAEPHSPTSSRLKEFIKKLFG